MGRKATQTNKQTCLGTTFSGKAVCCPLFIVTSIVGVCNCSMYCCTLLYVHSSIAIILMGKRELIALLNLSSWCLVMVERLFLAVSRGCLQFVIVVFPDHTHLLLFIIELFQFCRHFIHLVLVKCKSLNMKFIRIFCSNKKVISIHIAHIQKTKTVIITIVFFFLAFNLFDFGS